MEKQVCPYCGCRYTVTDDQKIGAEMRILRDDLRVPMKAIATNMGVTVAYVSALELGHRRWTKRMQALYKSAVKKEATA